MLSSQVVSLLPPIIYHYNSKCILKLSKWYFYYENMYWVELYKYKLLKRNVIYLLNYFNDNKYIKLDLIS